MDLSLSTLKTGFPGVSPALGAAYAEACLVCFYRQQHSSGLRMEVKGTQAANFNIVWDEQITDQMLRSWNDDENATEWAACGIAFLLILQLTNFTVIRQSRRGGGFDYWLGSQNPETLLFEEKAKLEVSGIRTAQTEGIIKTRVSQKMNQVIADDLQLPIYVIVVEFSRPLAYVEHK